MTTDQFDVEARLAEISTSEQPPLVELNAAPVIDRWEVWAGADHLQLRGAANRGMNGGQYGGRIAAWPIVAIDVNRQWLRVPLGICRLGWRAGIYEPILLVALQPNWAQAHSEALAETGEHTLPPDVLRFARDAAMSTLKRARHAHIVAEDLRLVGRVEVAMAWEILAVTPEERTELASLYAELRVAAKQDDKQGACDDMLRGWQELARGRRGPTDDMIQSAHLIGSRVVNGRKIPALKDIDIPDPEPDDDAPEPEGDGVVVMGKVGGVEAAHGREAQRVFASIATKRLPVTPVPDLVVVRKMLVAEFPYASVQIDVVLRDLVGVPSVRFRPTLFVGPSGTGKSRLARRIGEAVGLHVVRYDAGSASDSSFAGTARRWSSGEPSVPVAALIAAKRADAMVFLDEMDKAASSSYNGRLQDSLLAFLEVETAARYPDVYAQAEVDCSRVSFIATANDELKLQGPLRDRFTLLRIPAPSTEDLPALCRGVVRDLVRESGADPRWTPDLDDDELYMAGGLWKGGSIRRLRDVLSRIIVRRSDGLRH